MKKLLYLFITGLLVLTSCSNDDKSSPILLKKRTHTANDGVLSYEDMVYDGDKIISITDQGGAVVKYTYTGDLISKTEKVNVNGKVTSTTEYTYTSGKLASSIQKGTDAKFYYKTKYTHNTDGTVSYDQFKGTVATGGEEDYGNGKLTFKDNNLVKLELIKSGSQRVYEYDVKNNPLKNVAGLGLLLENETAVNNVVKKTITSGSGAAVRTDIVTYSYKYDANNYPIEEVQTYKSGDFVVTETTKYVYWKKSDY